MPVSVGLDLGNADLKLVLRGHRLLVPHAVAPAAGIRRDLALLPADAEPLEYLHAELASPALAQPGAVFAGTLATREYPHLVEEVAEGEYKCRSDRHLLLALLAVAYAVTLVDDGWFGHRVTLAVALPLAEATDVNARRAIAARLQGEHTIRWLSTPRLAGRTQTLVIGPVDVLPEAGAAYLALAAQNPAVLDGQTLVVDIGARSLDWAAFEAGGRFALGLSGGTADGGLIVAADRILAAARETYGPHVARHRQDVLAALKGAALSKTPVPVELSGRGRAYDVTEIAGRELTRLARDVARLVTEAIDRSGRVQHVALVGGGGAMLAPYLRQVTDLPLTLSAAPEWANADGLYRRALQLGSREQVAR